MRDVIRLAHEVCGIKDGVGEIRLYGEIVPSGWEYGEDKSAAGFLKEVKELQKGGAKSILLRINSPGGMCTDAVAMRSVIANAGFESVTVRIEGMCASAATIPATIRGARVEIAEGSMYMVHNPWVSCVGTADDLEAAAGRLRAISDTIAGFYSARTGMGEDEAHALMDAETWMTAEEAVEKGFADEVLCQDAAAACVSQEMMEAMRETYGKIPEGISITQGEQGEEPDEQGSNGEEPTDNEEREEKAMTQEERAQIAEEAVAQERQRVADIDALTMPGYEEMAEQAKADGTPADEFQKGIVKAMREKAGRFREERQAELEAAASVKGGAPSDGEDDEAKAAKEIAEYAKAYAGDGAGGMF